MNDSVLPVYACTVFTLNIDDKIYHCPVSTEALYRLCRDQDSSVSQLDAYIALKMRVSDAVEKRLARGDHPASGMLEFADFEL